MAQLAGLDKGQPCSPETHISNWILATALWKWLSGKKKQHAGFRTTAGSEGHLGGSRLPCLHPGGGQRLALVAPHSPPWPH